MAPANGPQASTAAPLRGKKVLVTGADGFIGSHVTEHLVRMGAQVRAFVYYNSFNSWGWLDESPDDIKRALDVFAGDIRDPHGVRTAVKGCDVVMHLAALIAIPYSYHSPDTYVDTNVKGTLNIVQAARELGVERVVHTSTSEVYGTARSVPINRPIRRARSAPTRSRSASSTRSRRRSPSPDRSTPTGRDSRHALSSRRSSRRSLPGRGKSGSARWRRPAISTTSATRSAAWLPSRAASRQSERSSTSAATSRSRSATRRD
jgi:NAD(P)-dependent dehydrogenase (short-subunit alcohol dehydrogenase family)